MYLGFYCTYGYNSMPVTLHIWCHMHRTSAGLGYVNPGLCKTQLFCIFMLNYSNHRIAVCIADISIIRCALYSTFATKNSAHQLVWDITVLVLDKSSVMAVFHTQSKIFKSTYLRFNSTHVDYSMRIILHICCKTSRFVPCQLWTRSNSV